MDEFINKFNKTILFFIIYTLICIVLFKSLNYALPFVLAYIFSLILKKPTELLVNKLKIKRGISALITTLIFFTIIILVLSIGITSLTKEAIQLGKNTQNYLANNANNIYNFLDTLRIHYNNLDPSLISAIEKNLFSSLSKISDFTMIITSKIVQAAISFLTYIPYLFMVILFTLLSTYFFTKDFGSTKGKFLSYLSTDNPGRLENILTESKKMIVTYILSYLSVICISFLETMIGFLVLKVKYAVILSVVAAIFDILPILGIGGIYIPLALIYFFIQKNYFTAFGILVWYIVVTVVRQIIEPKIVSSSLGIHPVAVLAAIFIGLKINGILGMFFCIFLVVFYKVLKGVKVL